MRRWSAHNPIGELNWTPLAVRVHMSANAAQSKLRQGLSAEGFDMITHEVSVNGSGLDSCYLLVGCNPRLTRLALATRQHVGAATPITVLVAGDGAWSTLEAFDPMIMTDLVGNRALLAIYIDARFRIERVLA
ncbi:MAG: hypothetical protein HKN03_14260, partial [Acidimicrobiales bacterium]|nr:hypothetical protein [Acidimicrobiales bacterium]